MGGPTRLNPIWGLGTLPATPPWNGFFYTAQIRASGRGASGQSEGERDMDGTTRMAGTATARVRHQGPGLLVVRPVRRHRWSRSAGGARRRARAGQPGARLPAVQLLAGCHGRQPDPRQPPSRGQAAVSHVPALVTPPGPIGVPKPSGADPALEPFLSPQILCPVTCADLPKRRWRNLY